MKPDHELAMRDDAADRVIRQARARFADFAAKRSLSQPQVLQRVLSHQRGLARAVLPLSFLPLGQTRAADRRLVFLSTRFRPLQDAVREDHPILVGNLRDLRAARKSRMPFSLTFDLLAACYPIVEGNAGPLARRVIGRWLRFFERQRDPCHLIVPHDTLPLSTLLVCIANECRNVITVCVQHGLFDPSFFADDIDGRNCAVNLVYDASQRSEMERRLPGAIVEEMGLPADFRPQPPCSGHSLVVLVGTGVPERVSRYDRALAVFASAGTALRGDQMTVQYRPHPSESSERLRDLGVPLNSMSKGALLGADQRVFIGFSSTLLYEAGCAGHAVVVLDDPDLPGTTRVPSAIVLPTSELDSIADAVREALARAGATREPVRPLRDRFYSALDRAVARLASGTG